MKNDRKKTFIYSKIILSLAVLAITSMMISCSSSDIKGGNSVQEIYKEAVRLYTADEYLEASKLFDLIKLQYPASLYADDAQFYIAEINYRRKEYILGSFNYSMLRRVYPQSEYAKMALYKTAMCYYKLSPDFDRDQDYTYKAITALSEFQATYPKDSLYSQATTYIKELRNKLSYKDYFIGIVYEKMDLLKGSVVYFNSVIDDYSDTDSFEPSYYEKIKVLNLMNKKDDLKGMINEYKRLFPKSDNISSVLAIETQIKK